LRGCDSRIRWLGRLRRVGRHARLGSRGSAGNASRGRGSASSCGLRDVAADRCAGCAAAGSGKRCCSARTLRAGRCSGYQRRCLTSAACGARGVCRGVARAVATHSYPSEQTACDDACVPSHGLTCKVVMPRYQSTKASPLDLTTGYSTARKQRQRAALRQCIAHFRPRKQALDLLAAIHLSNDPPRRHCCFEHRARRHRTFRRSRMQNRPDCGASARRSACFPQSYAEDYEEWENSLEVGKCSKECGLDREARWRRRTGACRPSANEKVRRRRAIGFFGRSTYDRDSLPAVNISAWLSLQSCSRCLGNS